VDIHTDVEHDDASSPSQTADRRSETVRLSTGSGVVVAADGWILTNEHVVRDATSVSVELFDGTRHRVRQVTVHPKLDLAVLRIDRQDLTPLRFMNRPAERGMRVLAIAGSAFLNAGAVRVGVVTQTHVSLQHELDPRRTRLYDRLIESTTKIEPGFSGGPLVDPNGYVVGINVAVSGEGAGDYCRGYAIPLHARVRETVASLIDRARSESAWSPTASRR
jgi:S1-C subfamily serine protease